MDNQANEKWTESGVNVCESTVKNSLCEMRFKYIKAKRKPALTSKHKKWKLYLAK